MFQFASAGEAIQLIVTATIPFSHSLKNFSGKGLLDQAGASMSAGPGTASTAGEACWCLDAAEIQSDREMEYKNTMDDSVNDAIRNDDSVVIHLTRWFCVDGPVSRHEYVVLGFGLALVKYLIEFCVFLVLTGRYFTPLDFLNPWLRAVLYNTNLRGRHFGRDL